MARDNETLLELYRLMVLTRRLDGAIVGDPDGHSPQLGFRRGVLRQAIVHEALLR